MKKQTNKFVQLSLESDGTQKGTIIKENGHIIDNVVSIKWSATANDGFVEAEIRLIQVPAKLTNVKARVIK